MTRDFPRILVVTSNNFNLVTGGGITLTNLFRGWPSDRLANLHEDRTPEDLSVCRTFYRLSEAEIRWRWPFSLARPWYGRVKEQGAAAAEAARGDQPAGKPWLSTIKQFLGDGVPKYACLTDPLLTWVRAFRPTLLYAFLGSLEQMDLTRRLADHLRIPLAVHLMDDWPAVLYSSGWFAPVLRPILRRSLDALLARASARLTICDAMSREYEARYGYRFQAFQNALETERWLPQSRRDWQTGSPFLVRYVGSIVPHGQRESLEDIARAVVSLSAEGMDISLHIHAPRHDSVYLGRCRFPPSVVRLEGPPEPESIVTLLAGADLLVLPYNFDARSARYIRLSLPTKAPAYMMSGTPVLVYAPGDVATAEYAAREEWGYVVSSPGEAPLREALCLLARDAALRERLGRRARRVAECNHDATKVRAAFWDALCEAAKRPGSGARPSNS